MTSAAPLNTPILLLVFNRPEATLRVMESIRGVRPARLFVAADGPRAAHAEDAARCEEARKAATDVDWPCEIHRLYRERNLGLAVGVSTAINWFFERVEQGIILEDDCVPSRSFYQFCEELLTYHRNQSRIMHVAGTSFQYGRRRGAASYYYSRIANVWGWATWRRAWQHYDFTLRPSWQLQDTWSTQWQLSIERAGGLAVVPSRNLVRNIGFGPGATHTREGERAATLVAGEMSFPLRHPVVIRAHRAADAFTYYVHHRQVKYPSLVAAYGWLDWAYARLKPVKRWLVQLSRREASASDLPAAREHEGGVRESLRERAKIRLRRVRTPILREMIRGYLGWRSRRTERARYERWVDAGRPLPPPPHHKQAVVRDAGRRFSIPVLIETGTFEGQMVEAVSPDFRRIFTIELDRSLSARATELFKTRPHVRVVQGDTREALPAVLNDLKEPAVFWLDAHFSGGATAGDAAESPIMHELRAIASHVHHADHVILIDDAREFNGGAYPTLAAVERWATSNGYDTVLVQDDIIRIYRAR